VLTARSTLVQFDDVAIYDAVLGPYLLTLERAAAPELREFHATGNMLIHEPRHV
jgi:hypothetical protein